ncbi:MAG: glutamate 5-kinase [Hyphomonadaceae bacterium]|nr:glutamate 5-kinase [Hyphomonadaceae bacterium]
MTAKALDSLHAAKRIVVKIGSALVAENGRARQEWLNSLAADITARRSAGQDVILVSSGAIALGRGQLGPDRPRKLEEKQAAAALGQPLLMAAISIAFAAQNAPVAQALLTLEDTENRRRWLNARATLDTLLGAGAVPVINENDSVATDEIRYGDNDRLAARVAQMVGADALILLSDVDGLYTADPRTDEEARHIAVVEELTAAHDDMAGDINHAANVGSGGMATKLAAARIAQAAGCMTVITLGTQLSPVAALLGGGRATWVLPSMSPEKAREVWLRGHLTPEGTVFVDAGAVTALRGGASLLPVGVTRIEGQFVRGAAVAIKDDTGNLVGKGVTAYGSEDAARIAGLQSDAVEAELGYRGRPALVHRNDLILDS